MYLFNRRADHKGEDVVKGGRTRRCKLRIRFTVPAQEAKAVAPLSPILGQYGLSTADFCKQFNEQTAPHPAGVLMTVDMDIFFDRTFKFRVNGYDISDIIHSMDGGRPNRLLALDLYRLVFFYTALHGGRFYSNLHVLIGVIRASKIKIVV